MKRTMLLICWLLAAPTLAAEGGRVIGVIDRPDQVKAVFLIDRETDRKYPASFDVQTGRFTAEGLPLEQAYDCVIDFGSARLEGVNLTVPRSDYEEEQPLSQEDRDTIRAKALELNKFEDRIEILTLTGNIQHAAVVLNKLRTKPFYGSKPGEVVWRLELWHFEKPEEFWFKSQDELALVLYRQRLQKADYDKQALTLDPTLGGLRPTTQQPQVNLGTIRLPAPTPGVRLRAGKEKVDR